MCTYMYGKSKSGGICIGSQRGSAAWTHWWSAPQWVGRSRQRVHYPWLFETLLSGGRCRCALKKRSSRRQRRESTPTVRDNEYKCDGYSGGRRRKRRGGRPRASGGWRRAKDGGGTSCCGRGRGRRGRGGRKAGKGQAAAAGGRGSGIEGWKNTRVVAETTGKKRKKGRKSSPCRSPLFASAPQKKGGTAGRQERGKAAGWVPLKADFVQPWISTFVTL